MPAAHDILFLAAVLYGSTGFGFGAGPRGYEKQTMAGRHLSC